VCICVTFSLFPFILVDKQQKYSLSSYKYYVHEGVNVPVEFTTVDPVFPLMWYIEPRYAIILETGIFFLIWFFFWPSIKKTIKRIKVKWCKLLGIFTRSGTKYSNNALRREAVLSGIDEDDHLIQYGFAVAIPKKYDVRDNRRYDKVYRKLLRYGKKFERRFRQDYT